MDERPASGGGGRAEHRSSDKPAAPSRSFDRVPPHSLDAEVSVLGAALLSGNAATDIVQMLEADHFYRNAHRIVFEALQALQSAGEPVDTVTITDWLARHGRLDEVGGPAAIHDLTVATPTAANAAYYARIVRQKALLRRLIEAGTEVVRLGYDASDDADDVVDRAESVIYDVAQTGAQSEYAKLGDLLTSSFEQIEQLAEHGSEVTGLATGFNDLDRLTAGLQPQNLVIIAARPAMGKCLAGSSEIVDTTGRRWTIQDLVEQRPAGVQVNAYDRSADRMVAVEPEDFVANGQREVFAVSTQSGRHITVTANHPMLTPTGWQPIDQLAIGDQIAAPARVLAWGSCRMRDSDLRVLAAVLAGGQAVPAAGTDQVAGAGRHAEVALPRDRSGEGAVAAPPSGSRPPLDAFLLDEGEPEGLTSDRAARRAKVGERRGPLVTFLHRRAAGPVRPWNEWLTAFGLDPTQPATWRVPEQVFHAPQEQIALFVDRLFVHAGDHAAARDTVSVLDLVATGRTSRRGRPPQLSTPSLALARDVRHLLSRLGVMADVQRTESGAHVRPYQGRPRTAVVWDPIVAIEPAGIEEVYDLTVPGVHNFVANDLIVHNSSLALGISHYVATRLKRPAIMFSLEMSKLEIVNRLLSMEARIDSSRLRTGRLEDADWRKLGDALGTLSPAPLFIDDTPSISLNEIRAKCRRLQQKQGLDLVIIDYLQLMQSPRRIESRQQEVAEISRGLKMLAKQLDVPVVALSQLSRQPESRTDKRPQLADLRESGSIEQDADLVGFIYRDEVYDEDSPDRGIAELIIAKHRNGATGVVRLAFLNHLTTFANLARGPALSSGGPAGPANPSGPGQRPNGAPVSPV